MIPDDRRRVELHCGLPSADGVPRWSAEADGEQAHRSSVLLGAVVYWEI